MSTAEGFTPPLGSRVAASVSVQECQKARWVIASHRANVGGSDRQSTSYRSPQPGIGMVDWAMAIVLSHQRAVGPGEMPNARVSMPMLNPSPNPPYGSQNPFNAAG